MLLGWVKRGLGSVVRFVVRFFFRSFDRAMGCFFACFRIKDNDDRPRRNPLISTSSTLPTDVLVSRNSLSSVFQSQEREDCEIKCDDGLGSLEDELELKAEAKFLKACGTLTGTPVEIRKASEKLKLSPTEPPTFHSWLPNASVTQLQLDVDVQPFNPTNPVNVCQEWGDSTDSSVHTPSSCVSSARDNQCESLDMGGNETKSLHTADRTEKKTAMLTPWSATDIHRKTKSVRFECDTDLSSCGSSSDDCRLKNNGSSNNQSANKPSPYPTPLKLSDEMQTPGTVCPSTLEEFPSGKLRVRSQFVYPIHKPGENTFRCMILEDKDSNPEQDSSEMSDSAEQAQNATPTSEKGLNKDECKAEVGLSCLKLAPTNEEERHKGVETAYSHVPHFHKTPAERPIIGAVAAHFQYEDSSVCPTKCWDGNGIPNTTTKIRKCAGMLHPLKRDWRRL